MARERELDGDEGERPIFIPLGASHEEAGAISSFGECFNADEVSAASRLQQRRPALERFSVTDIALFMKEAGVKPELSEEIPEQPLEIRKDELRQELSKLLRRLAKLQCRSGATKEQERWAFQQTHLLIRKYSPAKNIDDLSDNYPIEYTERMIETVKRLISEEVTESGGRDAA
jgi:hypothetical protein